MTDPRPYDFFSATVSAIRDVTPSFRRFTFEGADLARYADPGFDQRIKVMFPTETAPLSAMPRGEDWYDAWRALDDVERPVMRTYTTRAVRRLADGSTEVDIDMVAHAVLGPASAWIDRATIGDELLIYGISTDHEGVSFGIDFVPPARTEHILLAGDETAAPAIAVILEQLPREASGIVVIEVPSDADATYLPSHPGFDIRIAGRTSIARGAHLITEVERAAAELAPAGRGAEVEEIDVDEGILWEVPRTAKGGAALKSAHLYAWLAGEAGVIKQLRRHLVTERGVDRRAVAFMGYWREGRAEN